MLKISDYKHLPNNKSIIIFILLFFISQQLSALNLPEFKYGFGIGINFSIVDEVNTYRLYEDLTGEEYLSEYSGLFSNFGNQYFFHAEFIFEHFQIALKPGSYTYKFNKTDEIIFNTETIEQKSGYLLRYLNFPLEVKWIMGDGTLKPFIGGEAAFGYLLRQGGDGNHSFIKPRISVGPIAGAFYNFDSFDLVLTAGYDYGLHIITQKADRYNTAIATPYSQSDLKLHNINISLSVLFSTGKSGKRKSLKCVYPNARRPK